MGALGGLYLEQHNTDNEAVQTGSNRVWGFLVDTLMFIMGFGFFCHVHNSYFNMKYVWEHFGKVRIFVWSLVLVGLSNDGGKSISSKALQIRIIQFIGTNSFQLYLMQFFSQKVIEFVLKDYHSIPDQSHQLLCTLVPIVVAHIVRKAVDEPIQNILA